MDISLPQDLADFQANIHCVQAEVDRAKVLALSGMALGFIANTVGLSLRKTEYALNVVCPVDKMPPNMQARMPEGGTYLDAIRIAEGIRLRQNKHTQDKAAELRAKLLDSVLTDLNIGGMSIKDKLAAMRVVGMPQHQDVEGVAGTQSGYTMPTPKMVKDNQGNWVVNPEYLIAPQAAGATESAPSHFNIDITTILAVQQQMHSHPTVVTNAENEIVGVKDNGVLHRMQTADLASLRNMSGQPQHNAARLSDDEMQDMIALLLSDTVGATANID